jgi:hypothetical protein
MDDHGFTRRGLIATHHQLRQSGIRFTRNPDGLPFLAAMDEDSKGSYYYLPDTGLKVGDVVLEGDRPHLVTCVHPLPWRVNAIFERISTFATVRRQETGSQDAFGRSTAGGLAVIYNNVPVVVDGMTDLGRVGHFFTPISYRLQVGDQVQLTGCYVVQATGEQVGLRYVHVRKIEQ